MTPAVKHGLLADTAEGMSYLYGAGVEHRDLKSANCLVTHDWRVKVIARKTRNCGGHHDQKGLNLPQRSLSLRCNNPPPTPTLLPTRLCALSSPQKITDFGLSNTTDAISTGSASTVGSFRGGTLNYAVRLFVRVL